ncbi:hypothetical protein E2562_016742 [Oryza meyeriana var. granulata]|uniref:Uncharacterized protein n=1 Tax=Oryza meyeriana var. granulata TaxID=110450 RepID=A0A6G1BVR8_9ORYZ|nr:hypothetical protein E2562_016742 [Oryza meyeriana var. granulata]
MPTNGQCIHTNKSAWYNGSKDPKKRVADMPPGGIKPRYKREGNYSDEEPDALDLFKECHYSKKKKGFTPAVQLAITEMESKIYTPTEGEESISTTQAMADVLDQKTKKNQFLLNVGLRNLYSRNTVENTEAQLEAEKMAKNELLKQVEVLSKQVEETEHARIRDQEEIRKKQTNLEAKLQLLATGNNQKSGPPRLVFGFAGVNSIWRGLEAAVPVAVVVCGDGTMSLVYWTMVAKA